MEGLVSRPVATARQTELWRERNVFITGCTGLLGGWLTQALVGLGANVDGLVRDFVPNSRLVTTGLINQITTVRGSLTDPGLVERALNEYEIETVFHVAAQALVGIANRNPISTFETNIRGTWTVLEAARHVDTVKQLVVASSDKAYGYHATLPYDEGFALRGDHPYDVSKSCADLIAASYAKTFGSPVAITRCGNFFGGGDLNFNRIVPGTIRSVILGQRPVIRSDGTMTRDYIYIEDAVHGYLLLAEKLAEDPSLAGMAFNFSCEQPATVLQMTDALLQVMGREDLTPIVLNQASNEIPHQWLNAGLARERLGWHPMMSREEGLQRTVAWYEEFFRTKIGARYLKSDAPSPVSR